MGKHVESCTPSRCFAAFPVQLKTTFVFGLRKPDEIFESFLRITRTPCSLVSFSSRYWICNGALIAIVVNDIPNATSEGSSWLESLLN